MLNRILLLVTTLTLTAAPAHGQSEPAAASELAPSAQDVLAMAARLPPVELPKPGWAPGGWERGKDAPAVAAGIAKAVAEDPAGPLFDTKRLTTAVMVTYGVFESGMRRCPVGDGGKALGPFQLQGFPESVACDPDLAAGWWLRKAHRAIEACPKTADTDARLASLGSGWCNKGHVLARRRVALARMLLEPAVP